jgi:pyridoxine 5-phosphate synthase
MATRSSWPPEKGPVRLHVNIDHVATLARLRDTRYPDLVAAAMLAESAGADGITVHLREDRRHIQDADLEALRPAVRGVFNLEMAVTDEMVGIAKRLHPAVATFVPERREERTTEGGLDVLGHKDAIARAVEVLRAADVRPNLFVVPDLAQLAAAAAVGAHGVELHTGEYCREHDPNRKSMLLAELRVAATEARFLGLTVAAGHGLYYDDVRPVAAIPEVEELNIGHGIVSRAVLVGMERAVREMVKIIRP